MKHVAHEELGERQPGSNGEQNQPKGGRTDLLLRFFDSEFFNEWIAVQYLYTSKSEGVHDYICNRIYSLPDTGIEMYLSQMITMVCERNKGNTLERCIIDLCARSLRLAVKVHWFLMAASEDRPNDPKIREMQKQCETAAIEGKWVAPCHKLECHETGGQRSGSARGDNLHHGNGCQTLATWEVSTQTQSELASSRFASTRTRQGTYHATLEMVRRLASSSDGIKAIPTILEQQSTLRTNLHNVNTWLAELPSHAGVLFPMGTDGLAQVVRVPPSESALLNSRDKAPFMLCLELIDMDQVSVDGGAERWACLERTATEYRLPVEPDAVASAAEEFENLRVAVQGKGRVKTEEELAKEEIIDKQVIDKLFPASTPDSVARAIDAAMTASHPAGGAVRIRSVDALADMMRHQGKKQLMPPKASLDIPFPERVVLAAPVVPALYSSKGSIFGSKRGGHISEAQRRARLRARTVFGERWSEQVARVREASPFGSHPRWRLYTAIVKSGDDCRQELLAIQLLQVFESIFREAGLPLWMRPFQVLVTSSHAAIIETIPNALSIHAIKARSPPGTCLRDHFVALYGEGTAEFRQAQRNFVESLAAYSMVSYLLQMKDRHNGNLLLDDEGHLIHIDFGFMLSNSPGGVNFETAPFKLTRELLEVMDSDSEGTGSELFDYFKVLCIQGFLAARKHADRIVCLVEMMSQSGAPCFKAGPSVLTNLRKRFAPGRPEEACVETVLQLISDSLDAWRTRQYDYYQRVLNGIL